MSNENIVSRIIFSVCAVVAILILSVLADDYALGGFGLKPSFCVVISIAIGAAWREVFYRESQASAAVPE